MGRSLSAAVHRRHFTDISGGLSPQEYHAANAFPNGAKCNGCGGRPLHRCIRFMPMDEAKNRGYIPQGTMATPAALAPFLVLLKGSDGRPVQFLRHDVTYSCDRCRPAHERTIAHETPSWAAVDWNHGPKSAVIFST
jgi:hypothetical protein